MALSLLLGWALLPSFLRLAEAESPPQSPQQVSSDNKDLCSYLKDVAAKTDADCGEEALAAFKSNDISAYSRLLDFTHKRKPEVLKAYELLKAPPSAEAVGRKATDTGADADPRHEQPTIPGTTKPDPADLPRLDPPINERTFPAWVGPEAKDLKEVYTRWLHAQNRELQQEKGNPVSAERHKEIDATLARNQARIKALGRIGDPGELGCFLGESCGTKTDLSDPSTRGDATGNSLWTKADFERANAEANPQYHVPGGKIDRSVPALGMVASEAAANTPLGPLAEQPSDGDQGGLGAVATMALATTGALLLFGGLGGKALEEKFPNVRRDMGIAAAISGTLAAGAVAWDVGAARLAATAVPIAADPATRQEAQQVLTAEPPVVQRFAQSASNLLPEAPAGLQRAAVLEQQLTQEFNVLRTLGRPGSDPRIRLIDGTAQEAQALFQRLSRLGAPRLGTSYPGKIIELPNGARVGFRLRSTSGPPTIVVHDFPGFAKKLEIKFIK